MEQTNAPCYALLSHSCYFHHRRMLVGDNRPRHLYLNPILVVRRYEIWRLITNFLYFGKMEMDFIFNMFRLVLYCKQLEENSFRGRPADFFYILLFSATVLTGIVLVGGMIPYVSDYFASIFLLSNSLNFMMLMAYMEV
ncbi:derlin-2.2-like [Tasmannia lanceolata]|uniref:derlin-2.2-like n=1 Tax=Tasmannia lanceolata TaxID=3420 RepID=UPI004063EA13